MGDSCSSIREATRGAPSAGEVEAPSRRREHVAARILIRPAEPDDRDVRAHFPPPSDVTLQLPCGDCVRTSRVLFIQMDEVDCAFPCVSA